MPDRRIAETGPTSIGSVTSKSGRFTSEPSAVSARMRLIRSKGTKPELQLYAALARAGLPYQTHVRVLGVEVDALVEGRLALFVDLPFWHLRERSTLGRLNPYWCTRLITNKQRDRRQTRALRGGGYAVLRFWSDEFDERRAVARVARMLRATREPVVEAGLPEANELPKV